MKSIQQFVSAFVFVLVLVNIVIGGASSAPAPAGHSNPELTEALPLAPEPGTITVSGDGFTPGGEVYIAIYDRWGAALHETRWITASPEVFGPNGSQDPARGYLGGGESVRIV